VTAPRSGSPKWRLREPLHQAHGHNVLSGTISKNKPPGNSPENARGLDLLGFADLEYAMCFNCVLAWHYPYGDPPSDLRPGDAQGGVVPHGADLGGRGRALERARHG
jgi:hypothetical protein